MALGLASSVLLSCFSDGVDLPAPSLRGGLRVSEDVATAVCCPYKKWRDGACASRVRVQRQRRGLQRVPWQHHGVECTLGSHWLFSLCGQTARTESAPELAESTTRMRLWRSLHAAHEHARVLSPRLVFSTARPWVWVSDELSQAQLIAMALGKTEAAALESRMSLCLYAIVHLQVQW